MSDCGYEPYEPLNVLKPVADDIWIVDGPNIRFGWGGFALPFPTRMTIVRLPDGGLWLHSPTIPDAGLLETMRPLGPVRFLIAPNLLHYWWIPDWMALFPDSEVYAVPGLARSAKRRVEVHHLLSEKPPSAWRGAIDQIALRGGLINETVFFHRLSQSLILTDLIENFERQRTRSRIQRFVLRLGGVFDPDGKSPFDMRVSFLPYRSSLRMAVKQMIEWAPERVILAHGRWYPRNGTLELRRAFRWLF